jgi:hypothetical protein
MPILKTSDNRSAVPFPSPRKAAKTGPAENAGVAGTTGDGKYPAKPSDMPGQDSPLSHASEGAARSAPTAPPSLSQRKTSFRAPAHQEVEHFKRLAREETDLRDACEFLSPEWVAHDGNVSLFKNCPDPLRRFTAADLEKEKGRMQDERAGLESINKPMRARKKAVAEETEKEISKLFRLENVRWAAQNHAKITGKPVFGVLDSVPALDAGAHGWFGRTEPKQVSIKGLTEAGLTRDIEATKARLDVLARESEAMSHERVPAPHMQLEFPGRAEIQAKAESLGLPG